MEKSMFFNSINGDRLYSATDFAAYFASMMTNGVWQLSQGNPLAVTPAAGSFIIYLSAGKAWINGYGYQNTATLSIPLQAANMQYPRIDLGSMPNAASIGRSLENGVPAGVGGAVGGERAVYLGIRI